MRSVFEKPFGANFSYCTNELQEISDKVIPEIGNELLTLAVVKTNSL